RARQGQHDALTRLAVVSGRAMGRDDDHQRRTAPAGMAGAVRVRRARRDGRDQHGPGPADAPPGEPATGGVAARRRVLHELLAVQRDQGLGDFRMHDASWLPFGTYWERVLNTMYLELASVKIYLEFGWCLGPWSTGRGCSDGCPWLPGFVIMPRGSDISAGPGSGVSLRDRHPDRRYRCRCRRHRPAVAVRQGRGTRAARTRPARHLAGDARDPCAR